MKRIFLLLLSFGLAQPARAQKPDSMVDLELRYAIARKAVRGYFAQYATGQEISGMNNYVNYDTKDNRLTLNGIIPVKNPDRLLSVKVNGAIHDGIATLFTKSKVSSNTSMEVRLHLLGKKRWTVILDDEAPYEKKKTELRVRYRLKKDSLELYYQDHQYKLKETATALSNYQALRDNNEKENQVKLNVIHLQDEVIRYQEYIRNHEQALIDIKKINYPAGKKKRISDRLKEEMEQFRIVLDSLPSRINTAAKQCNPSDVELTEGPVFPWYKVSLKSNVRYDSLIIANTRTLNRLSGAGTLEEQRRQLETEKEKTLKTLGDAVSISERKLSWITISAGVANRTFQHITTNTTYESQLNTLSFLSPAASLGFHKIRTSGFSNRVSYYRLLSFSFLTSDNFSSLDKREITETHKVLNKDSTEERGIRRNFNAYAGEYKKNLWAVNVSYDWYGMFNRAQSFGVHLFPSFRVEKGKQEFTSGAGLFMNFLKADSKQAVATLELFAKFLQPHRGDLLNNMTAGIQIGIPVNLKQQ